MPRLFASILILVSLLSFELSAQILTQNFDGITAGTLPASWRTIVNTDYTDNNNAAVTGATWRVDNPSLVGVGVKSSPNAIIVGAALNERSSDWVFTNAVTLSAGTFYNLSVAAAWTNPLGISGAPPVSFGYCKDINGNGIPEPLGADASGYTLWSGLGSGPNAWTTYTQGFTVPSTGSYFICFLSQVVGPIITDTGTNYLALDNLTITPGAGLLLNNPAGGEVWNSGSTHQITWVSSNVTNIKIEYTTDFGFSWNTLASSVAASTGSYTWNLPVVSETKTACYVKITSTANSNVTSQNAAPFTIKVKGSVVVDSPNGSEKWNAGSSQYIIWTPTDIIDVRIDFSTNNGVSWTNIVPRFNAANSSYLWTVPSVSSTQCKIKVSDADDTTASDQSNSVFSIISGNFLTLNSPNGGETWLVGSQHDITWSDYGVTSVKLEYSTNNGTSWTTIITSTSASTGLYHWTVPNSVSTQCLVRISDLNSSLNDISNDKFIITNIPNSITVVSPNGGEHWLSGKLYPVTWTSSGVKTVKLWYSTDNGVNWILISGNVSASAGTYSWTTPMDWSCDHVVIIVSDSSNQTLFDKSNANFSVNPKLLITAPAAGVILTAGANYQITYQNNGVSAVNIFFSSDNGNLWSPVVSSYSANNTFYNWLVPDNPGTQSSLKVISTLDPTVGDTSDAFTIVQAPLLTLTSPVGGESWAIGSPKKITWISHAIDNIKIEYSTDSGSSWNIIISSTPASTGSYSLTVPNTASTKCKIRLTNLANASMTSVSTNVFTILVAHWVNITSPNGGEKWVAESVRTVTWNSSANTSFHFYFSTNKGVNWYSINPVINTPGQFDWTVYNSPSTQCLIRCVDVTNLNIADTSDAVFSITPPASIKIISPNGGEIFTSGSRVPITWTSNDVENIKISYQSDFSSGWHSIVSSYPADSNSYLWTVPNIATTIARVLISSVKDTNLLSVSKNYFTIQLTKNISVLQPNGGEIWRVGTQKLITWASYSVSNVKIDYSSNNGTTWNPITASVSAASQSYLWTVPQSFTSQCVVRLIDLADSTTRDLSDTVFTITNSVSLLSPIGGEVWKKESVHKITWTNAPFKTAQLEYSSNNGSSWLPIANSVPAAAPGYSWTVPTICSSNYLVRIKDSSDVDNYFVNPAPFTVFDVGMTNPVGGERFNGKDSVQITWSAEYVSKLKIEYSFDSGSSWRIITDSVDASLLKYWWHIPNLNVPFGLVRISNIAAKEFFYVCSSFTVTKILNPNLIQNGDFSNAMGNWDTYVNTPAAAILSVDNGKLFASITNGGTANWHIQLLQSGLNLQQGKTYDLTFDAYAASPRSIYLGTSMNSGSYTEYNNATAQLSATSKSFNFTLQMSSPTDPQARLFVNLGLSNINVYMDNIALREHDNVKSISLTAPLKDSVLSGNSKYKIIWNTQNISTIHLYYKFWNSSTWVPISQNINAVLGNYSWTVPNVDDSCQIKIVDASDNSVCAFSEMFQIHNITYVQDDQSVLPKDHYISQNYPNPFNPSTVIKYQLPNAGRVSIKIYNILGKEVMTLVDEFLKEGYYQVKFDASTLPSGIYIYQLRTNNFVSSKKMMLVK